MTGSVTPCGKDQRTMKDNPTTDVGIQVIDLETPTRKIEGATTAFKCPQRLEDRVKGVERRIAQRNAKKISTSCGKKNQSVQDCRKPKDYKPGIEYDGLPYRTVNRRTYNTPDR